MHINSIFHITDAKYPRVLLDEAIPLLQGFGVHRTAGCRPRRVVSGYYNLLQLVSYVAYMDLIFQHVNSVKLVLLFIAAKS